LFVGRIHPNGLVRTLSERVPLPGNAFGGGKGIPGWGGASTRPDRSISGIATNIRPEIAVACARFAILAN
jgi:hypothetical protein